MICGETPLFSETPKYLLEYNPQRFTLVPETNSSPQKRKGIPGSLEIPNLETHPFLGASD